MKVTYNTYSCAINGMNRESMKMDGRDSAECQNWEKKDIMSFLELFKLEKDKRKRIVVVFFKYQKRKT